MEPINFKITKCTDSARKEVYSNIPILQPSQKPPHGKSGKNPRIISAEVRENEEALLALLEEADDLSSTTELDSDSDTIVKNHKRDRQKERKVNKKEVKYSLDQIKNKLLEERSRQKSRKKEQKRKQHSRRRCPETDEEGEIHDTNDSTDSDFTSKTTSSDDTSMDDERSMVTKARKGKKKSKKLKSGISEKSRSANIEVKCKWPSTMLDGIFDKDEISFKELMLSQFVYGELCIWQRPKTSIKERKAREILLKKVIKNEPKLGFAKAKEIYKQFISKVEKGNVSWNNIEEIDRIETEVVLKCVQVVDNNAASSKKFDFKRKGDTIWCKDFNKGTCTLQDMHEQVFQGRTVKAHHICRKCYTKKKEKQKHKEIDNSCLLKE